MELEERTDSGKSEVEAATTIQAVYRGYKTRRKIDEVGGYTYISYSFPLLIFSFEQFEEMQRRCLY